MPYSEFAAWAGFVARYLIREFMNALFLTLQLKVIGGGRPRAQLSDGIRIVIITNPYWRCALGGLPPYSDTIRANVTLDRSAVFIFVISLTTLLSSCGRVCDLMLSYFREVDEPSGRRMEISCN